MRLKERHNFATEPILCFAILSKFISLLDDVRIPIDPPTQTDGIRNDAGKQTLIEKIQKKFTKLSNAGYMKVWFQRAIKEKLSNVELSEPLCKISKGEKVDAWNWDWIKSVNLKKIVSSANLVDGQKLSEAEPVVDSLEFDLFPQAAG